MGEGRVLYNDERHGGSLRRDCSFKLFEKGPFLGGGAVAVDFMCGRKEENGFRGSKLDT